MAKKKQQLSRRQFFGGATAVGGRAALSGAFTGSAAAATAAKMPFSSQMPQSWGGDPSAPFDEGALIWDLKDDPVHPKLLGHFHTGGSGAPQRLRGRSLRALSYGAAGLIALDISDVSNPQLVGRLDFAPAVRSEHRGAQRAAAAGARHRGGQLRGDRQPRQRTAESRVNRRHLQPVEAQAALRVPAPGAASERSLRVVLRPRRTIRPAQYEFAVPPPVHQSLG